MVERSLESVVREPTDKIGVDLRLDLLDNGVAIACHFNCGRVEAPGGELDLLVEVRPRFEFQEAERSLSRDREHSSQWRLDVSLLQRRFS